MTANWAGAIFKYYPARVKDDFLYDSGAVSDPDFRSNIFEERPLPVWAICGVFHRRDAPANDGMIFFVPVQNRWKETGLNDYICTGILVTGEKIPSKGQFLRDGRFDRGYLERYQKGLLHPKDMPRVKQLREQNIIVGNQSKSVWFGRNDIPLRDVLTKLGLHHQAKALGLGMNPAIPRLSSKDSENLYLELNRLVEPARELQGPERPIVSGPPGSSTDSCGCDEDDEQAYS